MFTRSDSETAAINALQARGVEVINKSDQFSSMLDEMGRRLIQSVLVEGGATLAGFLIDARLVNKITFFNAPIIIGGDDAPSAIGGTGAEKIADALELESIEVARHGRDVEITGYPQTTSGQ